MTEVANRQMACESRFSGLSPREDTQLIPYGYPLAFFFQYDDYWYLGKVGEKNGTETFRQHD